MVVTAAEKRTLLSKTGADAVEMEAAAVAANARRSGTFRFTAIRVVTDTAAESFPLDFNQMRDAGRPLQPRRRSYAAALPPFTRISRSAELESQACKHAAQALGDFIADTRF